MAKNNIFLKLVINITVSGFAVLLGVLLIEIFLRIFVPMPDPIIRPAPYLTDETVGHRFVGDGEFVQDGNVFYTDPYGNRIQASGIYPDQEDSVILVLGDSQTFGWLTETEDTFAVNIERLLQEQGKNIHTINAAAPGWSMWNYVQVLEQTKKIYPNIQGLVLYIVDNDWEPGDKYFIEDGYLEVRGKDDAAAFIPKIVRVKLNSIQVWRYATRAYQTVRHRGTEDQLATIPNNNLWNDAAGSLETILQNVKANQIPMVVIVDKEVAEVFAIMSLLESPSVKSILHIAEVSGGYLYDGHIDVDKHASIAHEVVDILIDYLP